MLCFKLVTHLHIILCIGLVTHYVYCVLDWVTHCYVCSTLDSICIITCVPLWIGSMLCVLCGGFGGFFLDCKDFGRMFDHSFPACTFFFFILRLACTHYFHFLGQDWSTVVECAEMTVAKCSLIDCV